mmetsp:Transcript_5892/g.24875  ORF Transcript_5892/g.24875 Transcript_5892/m.24875 type:complete len:93 (+) Transcript_5892:575-853(+)
MGDKSSSGRIGTPDDSLEAMVVGAEVAEVVVDSSTEAAAAAASEGVISIEASTTGGSIAVALTPAMIAGVISLVSCFRSFVNPQTMLLSIFV